ncbi:ABC transporter substrate-binding protein [Tessaracoccus sp. OH4464_COT-324]|uniref:ABC transporter substrate-binding protein n=1 Tax=Tessaracoccus sp. OH4464_COT-324 TaxID=2491059 RepID=UPI000F62E486|nr:ABC transporter substrate-binding protein [Tessaracoccus sp. OH4464_COT-324]RRD45628.1 ABC transporter substrate-binding protein [Tessaracoccus sp. OH4464_COT-324]
MKRRLLLGAAAALLLAACTTATPPAAPGGSGPAAGQPGKKDVRIGAVTIVSHPSLDLIYEGIKDGLRQAGYVEGQNLSIELANPQGDQATLTSIANTYAASDHDLYIAIATPPAQALAQVISDRPIVFASVTDPVAAGLVSTMAAPGGNVTGTSDSIPADQQLTVLREILPEVRRIGIVYTSSEVNAEVQAKAFQAAAEAAGIEVQVATVVNSSEVAQAAESLDVQAYWVGNDNVVVTAIESLVQVAEAKKALLFTSDADSVARGAAVSFATDYRAQGEQTAELIVRILEGADPATTPAEIQRQLELTVNPAAAQRMGVELPKSVTGRADRTV